jgi:prephenate dehydratase
MADILHHISIDADPERVRELVSTKQVSRTGGRRIRSAAPTVSAPPCSSTSAAATQPQSWR